MTREELENEIKTFRTTFLSSVNAARAQRNNNALKQFGGPKVERFATDLQPNGLVNLANNSRGTTPSSLYDGGALLVE